MDNCHFAYSGKAQLLHVTGAGQTLAYHLIKAKCLKYCTTHNQWITEEEDVCSDSRVLAAR